MRSAFERAGGIGIEADALRRIWRASSARSSSAIPTAIVIGRAFTLDAAVAGRPRQRRFPLDIHIYKIYLVDI